MGLGFPRLPGHNPRTIGVVYLDTEGAGDLPPATPDKETKRLSEITL